MACLPCEQGGRGEAERLALSLRPGAVARRRKERGDGSHSAELLELEPPMLELSRRALPLQAGIPAEVVPHMPIAAEEGR